jgi:aminopeptidase N
MRVRTRLVSASIALLIGVGVLCVGGGVTAAPGDPGGRRFLPGAPGAGDAYFPFAGNGGYDVQHYDLDITYTPPAPDPAPLVGQLSGVATIDLVATQNLDRFNLDLRDMDVRAITVHGRRLREVTPPAPGAAIGGPAYWQVQDDEARVWELILQPRPKLKRGATARVVVTYGGQTTRPEDIEGALYGWVTTRDGAMVVGEPEGSMTWYPVNDHPTDKATYSFEITVPKGKVAVANGLPARHPITKKGWTTWFWDAPDLQASYLTTASVGDYELRSSKTDDGLPIIDAIDDGLTAANAATTEASLKLQPDMIAFLEETFVPYPFNSFGSIVDDDSVGYALET